MPQIIDIGKRKSLADFAHGLLLPAPRSAVPHRRETFYPVACVNPDCTNVRWLRKSDAQKAELEQRMCRKCQTSQAGKRGFAVTRARYGPDAALRWVQQSQLAQPSSQEVIVDGWLADMAACYDAQVPFTATDAAGVTHNFVIDFVVHTAVGRVAVEVNGYHHKIRGAERDYWLSQLYPGQVLFIDTDDIDARPDAVKARLRKAIGLETRR